MKKNVLVSILGILVAVNLNANCLSVNSKYFQDRVPGQLVCIHSLSEAQFDDENYKCKVSYAGVDAAGSVFPITTHVNYDCAIPRLSAETKLAMTLGALFTFGMTTIAGGIDAYNNSKARDRIENLVKSECESLHENLQMMKCNN